MEATSPTGFLQGSTTLGGRPRLRRAGASPWSARPSTTRADSRSTGPPTPSPRSPWPACRLPGVPQAPPTAWAGARGSPPPATGNYFAPGTTPAVEPPSTRGGPSVAPGLELSYSVRTRPRLDAETVPTPTVVPLPTTATGLASIPLTLPGGGHLPRAPTRSRPPWWTRPPTPATTLGTTCMPYTVGAAGDGLDFATLPAGVGSGARPTPGVWPSTPSWAWTGCGASPAVDWGHGAARLLGRRPRRRPPAGRRP